MTSYEPQRSSFYSKDLRWHMVYQRLGLGLTFKTIGNNLGVDSSTVHRAVERYLSTGDLEKKKYDASGLKRKLTDEMKYFIIHVVLDNPGIMLHEVQKEINDAFTTDVSEGTICKALHQLNLKKCVLLPHSKMTCSDHCLPVK